VRPAFLAVPLSGCLILLCRLVQMVHSVRSGPRIGRALFLLRYRSDALPVLDMGRDIRPLP